MPQAIRRFVETLDYGHTGDRIAYVSDPAMLPADARWQEDRSFDETTELARSSGFREVLLTARTDGLALVVRAS
jgi:hypothetical protein